jgi:heptosyltransferase-2
MRPRTILVRFPNRVGDAVMATPALRALRAAHPDAKITLETRSHLSPLLAGLDSFDHFTAAPRGLRAMLTRARALRRQDFDWAVLLHDSPRAAIPAFLARTPRRVGYARDPLRRALLTDVVPPPERDETHMPIPKLNRYLAVVASLGCEPLSRDVELVVEDEAAERVARRLDGSGLGRRAGYVVVSPGASFGASKVWPAGSFATTCDAISRRHGLTAVLAPGPNEGDDARRVADAMEEPCTLLADPVLDLAELKALIAGACLVISNDTGPRHIAVAFARPVVVLIGPSDPRHSASQLDGQRVLREQVPCAPCHLPRCPIDHRCMTGISPFRAIAAAKDLLR